MRIKKLELKNFRGFEDLTIDFPEGESGLAVFVGVNGSGKTSIIEATANLLQNLVAGLKLSGEYSTITHNLKSKDIKFGKTECNIKLDYLDKKSSIESFMFNNAERTELQLYQHQIMSGIVLEDMNKGVDKLKGFYKKKNWDSIPIIAYYPVNRFIRNYPSLKAHSRNDFIPIDALDETSKEIDDFDKFFEWFRNAEDFENRKRLREDNKFRLKDLEVIRELMSTFLPGFSKPYIDRDESGEQLFVEKNEQKIPISGLSHGEKSIFAIISDISRRLSIANSENPLKGNGIVLIDEICQHLHPSWQRTIIPNLRRTFPNIQFILTTHSPQVLSNVPTENVFVLKDFKLRKFPPYHTYGKDSNAILEEVFETEPRPAHGRKDIEELYGFIDKNDRENAEKKLQELKEKFGDTDTDVVRAEMYVELMDE